MAKVTILLRSLLIALGVVGFLGTGSQRPTALIPAWFGLVFGHLRYSGHESQRGAAQAVHAC